MGGESALSLKSDLSEMLGEMPQGLRAQENNARLLYLRRIIYIAAVYSTTSRPFFEYSFFRALSN